MKKVLLIVILPLLFSCGADDASLTTEEVQILVEHYKTTSLLNGTAFIISEIGTETDPELKFRAQIANFNFEPGFTYRLNTTKEIIKNSGTNAKTFRFRSNGILDKVAVAPESEFRIPLIEFVNGQGTVSFLRRQSDSTFILSNEIMIDCEFQCGDLHAAFDARTPILGTFRHGSDGSYVLKELY